MVKHITNGTSDQLASRHAEDALVRVELHFEPAQVGEGFLKVVEEGVPLLGLDDDVVDVGVDVPADQIGRAHV